MINSKTLAQLFRDAYLELKNAGNENPHLEAGWIVEKFPEVDSLERIKNPEKKANSLQAEKVQSATKRRAIGEPLAYILEEKEFCGLKFKVTPEVLIPRPETEHLVDWAVSWLDKKVNQVPVVDILDLGAGSGCIGLSLAKRYSSALTQVRLSLLDLSKEALAIAKQNAQTLHLSDCVEFIQLDTKKANYLLKSFDLIVANPPYIDIEDSSVAPDVKKYEPHLALFAADNGLSEISGWLKALPNILKPDAAVAFEIGSKQGVEVLAMFRDLNIFSKHYIIQDYAKLDRIVCGEKSAEGI